MIEQQCLNGAGLLTAQGGPHCISISVPPLSRVVRSFPVHPVLGWPLLSCPVISRPTLLYAMPTGYDGLTAISSSMQLSLSADARKL
jgi:hypothetical protein